MSPLTISNRVVNFWTPVLIESKQTDIFAAVGRLADAYLSLGSHTVHWKTWQAEVSYQGMKQQRAVWFSQDIFEEGSRLKNGLLKAIKVASYILLFPTTLVALAIKIAYKELYVRPFVNVLGQADPTQLSFTREAKQRLIQELPNWLADHLPEKEGQNVKDYLLGLCKDEDVDFDFKRVRETIILSLGGHEPMNKTPIILRTLTIPSQDADLTLATQHIVKEAWKRVIQTNSLQHYAWSNTRIMTYDSYHILTKVLRDQSEDVQATIRNKHLNVVRLYPRLKVQRFGETISVKVP